MDCRGYDDFGYGPPMPPGRMMPPGRGMRRGMPPPPRFGRMFFLFLHYFHLSINL